MTEDASEIALTDRIVAVLDHLGIDRAHIATQSPGEIQGLVSSHIDRVGAIALVAPSRIDPTPFAASSKKILYIAPASGMLAKTAASVLPRLPNAKSVCLEGYAAESWSDLALDRPDLADLLLEFFNQEPAADAVSAPDVCGSISGVRYRALGSGPVVIVTPMTLAPSQWEPILPRLAENFRVLALAGPHLGMLALLEERAALADWQHMCAGLFDALAPSPGQKVLDVGCGSGAVARQFVRHTARRNQLTAIDLSRYLLDEAEISIRESGLEEKIAFLEGSAESLPFDDNSFDAAYSITVLEECNAQKAIAEMKRVVRVGGKIALAVRGTDLHQWWNMPLSAEVRSKIALPAPSVASEGVASAKLYEIAAAADLRPLRLHTYSVACRNATGPLFEYPEMYALTLLTEDERDQYQRAKAEAAAAGTLFMTRGHHCFVGEVA